MKQGCDVSNLLDDIANFTGEKNAGPNVDSIRGYELYNENNIDDTLIKSLKANCPISGDDNNLSPLDITSPTTFDNAFFKNLQTRKVFLQSNQQLFNGGSTNAQVNAYSSNLATFKTNFANAMVKMDNLHPLISSSG
ncbi:hypothetical protein NL676_018716 [Syzygium grande]|nr:hypothetical protein NL676_018716 [Syzygium grande]